MSEDKENGYIDHYMSVSMNRLDNRSIKRKQFDLILLSKSTATYIRRTKYNLENIKSSEEYWQKYDEYMEGRAKEKREERKRNELPYKLFPCLMVNR